MSETQTFDELRSQFSDLATQAETMAQGLEPIRRANVERELSDIYAGVSQLQPLGDRSATLNAAPSQAGVYSETNINREALSRLSENDTRARIESALEGTGISTDAVVARIETGANSAALERQWLTDDLRAIADRDGLNLTNRDELQTAVDRLDAAHVRLGEALHDAEVLRDDGVREDDGDLIERADSAPTAAVIAAMRNDSAADPFAGDAERAAYRAEIEARLDERQLEDLRNGDETALSEVADERLDRLYAAKAYLQTDPALADSAAMQEVNTEIASEEVDAARLRHSVRDTEKGQTHG